MRTTMAIGPTRERELALGAAFRPVGDLPLSVMAEARITQGSPEDQSRLGLIGVAEIAPFVVQPGLRAEFYGQGGLVTGQAGGGFVDAQLRLGHCLTCRQAPGSHHVEVLAGGGLWGGAQPGVARLEGGPGLSMRLPIGSSAALRLDADWRFRFAGNAVPGSGPVATLSAGFWGARP